MVFDAAKAIIKNCYGKGFTLYGIWKDNQKNRGTNTSVKPLIKRLVKCNTMNRQKEAGRPQTATTS